MNLNDNDLETGFDPTDDLRWLVTRYNFDGISFAFECHIKDH